MPVPPVMWSPVPPSFVQKNTLRLEAQGTSIIVKNYWRETILLRKDLLWFIISKALVHSMSASLVEG